MTISVISNIYMKRVKTLLKGTIENLVTDVVAETLYMLHFAECRHFSSIFDNLSEGLYSCGRKPSHVFNIKSGETIKVPLLFHVSVICVNWLFVIINRQSLQWRGSRIWSIWGPQKICPRFCERGEVESASKVSQYWQGSRTYHRALEALAFLTVKYVFTHFSWYFSSNFSTYICVGVLQNTYFIARDSEHFCKCKFF